MACITEVTPTHQQPQAINIGAYSFPACNHEVAWPISFWAALKTKPKGFICCTILLEHVIWVNEMQADAQAYSMYTLRTHLRKLGDRNAG